MIHAIPFPDLSPEIFSIEIGSFAFALRWYAMAYIVGILLGWKLVAMAVRRPRLWPGETPPMAPEAVESLVTAVILGIIVGGRLGFVLFYQPEYYLTHPLDIPKVWQGGMPFTAGSWALPSRGFGSGANTGRTCGRWPTFWRSPCRPASCWAGSPISSMPSFGGAPRQRPGG